MSDLVKRLRECYHPPHIAIEAADRIEELEAALEDISRVVKPNAYTDERLISRYLEKRIRGIVERSRQANE